MSELKVLSSVETDYSTKIDPESVKPLARKILSDVDSRGVADCWGAAALHEYVLENVDYDHGVDPNFNREPAVAAREGGNCVDLSVLLASLYSCIDLRCRLTVVRSGGGRGDGHMFPEVFFDVGDVEQLTGSLKDFYSEEGVIRLFQWNFFEEDSGVWMVSDPTGSSYLGDVQGLIQGGLVRDVGGGAGFQVMDRFVVE